MLSDSCPRRAHTQQFMKQKSHHFIICLYDAMYPCILCELLYVKCCQVFVLRPRWICVTIAICCTMPPFIRSCNGWECRFPTTKIQVENDFCGKTNQARCTYEELAGFGASWFKDHGDKRYCSDCLNMAGNEARKIKFRHKQDSHLWETCPACASSTVVTHEPNMTLVRADYPVCHLSTMAAQPLEQTLWVPRPQPKRAPQGLLQQQQPAWVPKQLPPVRATLPPAQELPMQEPPPDGGWANARTASERLDNASNNGNVSIDASSMLRAAPGLDQSMPRALTDGVTIDENSVQKDEEALAAVVHVSAELARHAQHLQIVAGILGDLKLQQHRASSSANPARARSQDSEQAMGHYDSAQASNIPVFASAIAVPRSSTASASEDEPWQLEKSSGQIPASQ